MATRRMLAAWVILVSCISAGCGTAGNLSQTPLHPHTTEYGGVKLDIEGVKESLYAPVAAIRSEGQHYSVLLSPITLTISVIDLPLSLVGDTLTLSMARERRHTQDMANDWLNHPRTKDIGNDSGGSPFEKAAKELDLKSEKPGGTARVEACADAQHR